MDLANEPKEIVVHIGHPKTGTTTLQKTFKKSAKALEKCGVLYPVQSRAYSHKLLIPLWLHRSAQESIERVNLGTLEQQIKRGQRVWTDIRRKFSEPGYRQLVLSSEHLYSWVTPGNVGNLRNVLDTIDADRKVVVYIREPSAAFLSNVQQHLKKSGDIRIPRPNQIEKTLTIIDAAGIGKIQASKFQRDTLKNENIIDDFCSKFLPAVKVSDLSVSNDAKTSLSAEAMALLQAHFRDDPDLRFLGKLGRTRREVFIDRFDKKIEGFSRPSLHPEIRSAYRAYATDYNWLAEHQQIEFPEAEPALTTGQDPHELLAAIKDVSDLCPVNPCRLAALKQEICNARASYNRTSIRLRELRMKIAKRF